MPSRSQIDEVLVEYIRYRGGVVLQREIVSHFRAQYGNTYPYARLQTLAAQGLVERVRSPDGKIGIALPHQQEAV